MTRRLTSRPIEAMTASGVDGTGVGTLSRSEFRRPALDVHDGSLDPAAADVDADGERADCLPGRVVGHRWPPDPMFRSS